MNLHQRLLLEEKGNRTPEGAEKSIMVDAALHAVDDILKQYPEALFYGQDVGGELGGVFREAALLAKKYGDETEFLIHLFRKHTL
jgi:2-oxoisovalerate dehydrogenase E1 component